MSNATTTQTFTVPSDWNKESATIETTGGAYVAAYGFTEDGRKIRLAEEDQPFGKSFYLPAGIDITRLEFVVVGGSAPQTAIAFGGGGGGGGGGVAFDGRQSGGDGGEKGQPGKPGR